MRIKQLTLFLFCIVCTSWVYAQYQGFVYLPNTNATLFKNNQEKYLGFGGGFNASQFAMGDLNNDGLDDLVVFEKGPLYVRTFINYGTATAPLYKYRPEYEKNFPIIFDYLKLIDYNCDNIPDLIHRGRMGISLHRGYYNSNNELCFEFYKELVYSPLKSGVETFEFSNFPPLGWTMSGSGWSRVTSGTNPIASPQEGSGMASFSSASLPFGTTGLLISKRLRISPNLRSEAKLSFWVYRNSSFPSSGDSISVYVSKTPSLTNAVYINRIARSRVINQPDTKIADGWYHYEFPLTPDNNYYGDSVYIIFKATARGGGNIHIDNISWISSALSGDINAYVEPNDIPGVADVDHDGDLDFFAHSVMGRYVSFYKNYAVEYGLPCDSVVVNLKAGCWGKTFQGVERTHVLGVDICPVNFEPEITPSKGSKTTHSGNTITMLDMDGDGDFDYLNGNVSYPEIQYLHNGKAEFDYPIDTIIAQDTTWNQFGHVLNMELWPVAYWLDIDTDGDNDLIFSPHTEGASENYKCVAWYENVGSNSAPNFQFRTDTLFVDQSVDLGTNTHPFLYDFNRDGKPDLIVGSEGYFAGGTDLRATLAYYENISTPGNIAFNEVSLNFLNVYDRNIRGAVPAIGDLDNDGKDDLILGHADGTISFYKNMAETDTSVPDWQLTLTTLLDDQNNIISGTDYAAPFIYDIDQDGLPDLLFSNKSSNFYFYKNTSTTPGSIKLAYQTNQLGNVIVDSFNKYVAYPTPFIGKIDNSPREYLMFGSNSGRIYRYTGFQDGNVTTPYLKIDSIYSMFREDDIYKFYPLRTAITVDDIDGDGMYDMVMGNALGGLLVFSQAFLVGIDEIANSTQQSTSCRVFPNPAHDVLYVEWDKNFAKDEQLTISLFNITGQEVYSKEAKTSAYSTVIPVAHIPPGTYICIVKGKQVKQHARVVIMR